MKVIVTGENEKVVGIHVIGMGADEMMQGFGVAMKVRLVLARILSSGMEKVLRLSRDTAAVVSHC